MKKFLTFATMVAATATLCCGIAACGVQKADEEQPSDGCYYLTFGETYTTEEAVPTAQRFTAAGDAFTLTIELEEGNNFTVRQVGSEDVLGYSALFSARTELEEGANGAIAVGESGTYAFTLQSEALSYTFTAKEDGKPDDDDPPTPPTPSAVTGVQLDKAQLSLELGGEYTLQATVLPADAANKTVVWNSDDEAVATVTNGTVTAVGYGTANITVTTAQGGFTAACEVTVVKHVSSLRFEAEELTVVANGKTKELALVFSPSDATEKDVEVEVTSGEEYAAVEKAEGKFILRGLAEGEATITATLKADPEITATCTVTVLAAGSELASMAESVTAMIGEPTTLTVSLESGEIESVEWSVANDAVATVEGDGAEATVTGVDFGTTVVTATVTAENGETYTATSSVLVADDFYFIYGYDLVEEGDWQYEKYLTDRNAAERDGLLFTEKERGIYTLTRHFTPDNGFQIIFPKVGNYTQHDDTTDEDVWSKNIPSHWVSASHYYSSANSTAQYVSNATEYFCVNAAGVYTVTLDLTGTSAKVGIKMVSLDVTDVQLSLTDGNYVLSGGDTATVTFTVSPSNADYTEEGVRFFFTSDFADYAKYLTCTLNFAERTLQLTAGEAPEKFAATLHFSVNGVEQVLEFSVLSVNDEKVPVTEVAFEQERYEFNVNNGKGIWTTTVKAFTNADATNGQVRYYDVTDYGELLSHASDERATVDPVTGEVTAKSLGTLKIKAVSLDNPDITATVEVLFYSDQIYIIAGYGTQYAGGWTAEPQNVTTLKGTPREKSLFTEVSHTEFTFDFTARITSTDAEKFKIVFLGMDDIWTGEINYTNIVKEFCNVQFGYGTGQVVPMDQNNIMFTVRATYKITIDLSIHKPVVLIDCGNLDYAEDFAARFSSTTDLIPGDTSKARLYKFPIENIAPDEFEVTYEGNDGYMSHTYDEATNTLTFTVLKQEHSEDKEVTVSIKLGDTIKTKTYTIVAAHHLAFTWDMDNHWYYCTDEGCTYFEDDNGVANQKSEHDKADVLSSNADGHYYACSKCGVELGLQPHEYDCPDGVFDFSEDLQKCKICHLDLFKIEGNTLVYYYGREEVVNVPDTVTVIGAHAFEGHDEIRALTYSRQVREFGEYAFAGCSNLESLSMTNYLAEIWAYAFKGTAAKLVWGHSPCINHINQDAFSGYLGKSITIPETVNRIASCFSFSNIESIVIPNSVVNSADLPSDLFRGCTSLRTVEIGTGIATLGSYTFWDCSSLETIIIRGSKFWQFQPFCFYNCTSLQAIYIERPLAEVLTCKKLFGFGSDHNSEKYVKGKVYAYSAEDPGDHPFMDLQHPEKEAYSEYFGYFKDWFAGCWHWDESGKQNLKNIVLWDSETAPVRASELPAVLGGRKERYL